MMRYYVADAFTLALLIYVLFHQTEIIAWLDRILATTP